MIKRKLSQGDWFLLIANLLPVYGVWFHDWDFFRVFLVYCMETLIIGFYTVIKLLLLTFVRKDKGIAEDERLSLRAGIFFVLFFIVHYGMFVFIQTTMFLKFSPAPESLSFTMLLSDPGRHLGKNGLFMLAVFAFSYGYEQMSSFILNNEYRTKSVVRIMFEPYIRIFIQQFTVIIGSIFLMLDVGKVFIVVFAAVKTWFTIFVDYESVLKKAQAPKRSVQESSSSHS